MQMTLEPPRQSLDDDLALIRLTNLRLYNALMYHRNTKGERMTFDKRVFLIPIYDDQSQVIVVQKSVQCGISEWLICETLTQCENGLAAFYVLPKYEARNTFVSNRVDKLFMMVPRYRTLLKAAIGDADSTQIKHYAKGTIKFVSSNTPGDFHEYPADMVVIDELDLCDQGNIDKAEDRLGASKYKLVRKVANPSISGFGIANEFKASDQKEWFIKCGHCNEWQPLDFFLNICREIKEHTFELVDREWKPEDKRDISPMCHKCGESLDRESSTMEWVPRNTSSRISGYHISKLIDPQSEINALWLKWLRIQGDESKVQKFFNSDLGLPYEARGAKLSGFLLDKCVDEGYLMPSSARKCVAGVDVGSVLNVKISEVIDGKRRACFIGTVPRFEDVDALIKIFDIKCLVIDALPETHKARELYERHKSVVWLCEYHTREGSTKDIHPDQDKHTVSVDRTASLDESHADILMSRLILPTNAKSIDDGQFYEQMCAPTRILLEDKSRYVWKEGTAADHYRHADNYEMIAAKINKSFSPVAMTAMPGHDVFGGN